MPPSDGLSAGIRANLTATAIVFAADNYLRICGQVRLSMALNILMSILSAALEFLFPVAPGGNVF